MRAAQNILAVNDRLPIKTSRPVHSGKVRSVYWLDDATSKKLIEQNQYLVPIDTPLAIMVISDRLSAFDCIWHAEGDWQGVPGKGAALNAISHFWFEQFKKQGLADSHIVDIPHPFVWIVRQAKPIKIEAIARQYITGSMWRAYQAGERHFCGIELPDGLTAHQRLENILITPSTKGILKGIPGVPEADDVNITRKNIVDNYRAFNFEIPEHVKQYEHYLTQGFTLISEHLANLDQIFVDTKFEFGYVKGNDGQNRIIYMDEVGTPDSSRIWDGAQYRAGNIVENSKEGFRQALLNYFDEPEILLNKERMPERIRLASDNALPRKFFEELSSTYLGIAEKIVGHPIHLSENPEQEIIDVLNQPKYQLIG